ncbi:MAG: glycosyltransferase [Clostridia bacterium]|nr:glycosyltransferase [Clostridia bacterium]
MKKPCNILLSLMQLNIGGAETHVVELAKELSRRGHTVIVASNGGVYTQELAQAGIKHYIVPLQNKNPFNVLKAFKTLRKIIIDEKIDIVHSHARIPSFILGKLRLFMKFPFVTTAHWVFTTKYGLKYITDWGQKTIAVSEDIKTYLMVNYKIPESDIKVTINGIDTDKFSPDTDTSDVMQSFNLSEDDNIIVYVSRLDESRSLVAKQLIELIPELNETIENLKLVIVGGGDDYENICSLSSAVNEKLQKKSIILTGARTDINKFAALGRVFVGVSRAALEAMASAKPTIIAGNEGYIGLFNKDKLKEAVDTNFCCRGCEVSSAKLLKRDILAVFAMSENERKALGMFGRELIKSDYSVAKMTDDTVEVYESVLK